MNCVWRGQRISVDWETVFSKNMIVEFSTIEQLNFLYECAEKENKRLEEHRCYLGAKDLRFIFGNFNSGEPYKNVHFLDIINAGTVMDVGVGGKYKNKDYEAFWSSVFCLDDRLERYEIHITTHYNERITDIFIDLNVEDSLLRAKNIAKEYGFDIDIKGYNNSQKIQEVSLKQALSIISKSLRKDEDKIRIIVGGE